MKKDSKLFKILINLDIVIASIALVILVGCTFAGVIARYVVGKPFGWIGCVHCMGRICSRRCGLPYRKPFGNRNLI